MQFLPLLFALLAAVGCGVGPMTSRSEHLGVRGLHTDSNPFSAAPPGSLTVADNCVIERLGMIEPRPGFYKAPSPVSDESVLPVRLFPWFSGSSDTLRMNTDDTVSWATAPATPIVDEASSDVEFYSSLFARAVEARKNLYINASDGVRKLTSPGGSVAYQAGISVLPVISSLTYGSTGTALLDESYVVYRVLLVRTDANGVKVRSASSGAYQTHNTTGGVVDPQVVIVFSGTDTYAGDTLELYRTRNSTVEPGDETYLTASFTLTSSEISAGTYTFDDVTTDDNLGAACYINASREGVEGSNFAPPIAGTLGLFNGSVFAGGVLPPKRIVLRYPDWGNRTGLTTGIGYRGVLGKRTNGSAVVALSPAVPVGEMRVGQIASTASMSDWSGSATEPVILDTITSNVSITMSQTWTGATDAGYVAFGLFDSIHFGTDATTGYWPIVAARNFLATLISGMPIANVAPNTTWFAYAPGVYAKDVDGGGTPTVIDGGVTIILEERHRGDTNNQYIQATGGDLYHHSTTISQGTLPTTFTSTDVTIPGDPHANMLVWSKKDEPEHFAPTSYEPVGLENKAILALAPSRDALWVFKQDGLWRLSGASANSGWRIDPFDPTLYLLTPDSWVVLDDVVYAWTNRGPVMVTDGGVVPMGDDGRVCPIQSDLDSRQRRLSSMANWSTATWMTADQQRSNVLLGVEVLDAEAGVRTQYVYCFNARTREWTRWLPVTSGLMHMAYDGTFATLIAGNAITGDIQIERTAQDVTTAAVHTDYDYEIEIDSVDGDGLVTIIAGDYEATVGDAIVQTGATYHVVTTPSSTTFTVGTEGLVAGDADAYVPFTSTIEWSPKGTPTKLRRFKETLLAFSQASDMDTVQPTFRTADASDSFNRTVPDSATPTVRALVPRSCAKATALWPGVEITQALSTWRVSGVGIVYDDIAEGRVVR